MTFDWFKIFNYNEFLSLGLVSKVYTVELVGIGQRDILVTYGNEVSVVYEDVFMPVEFNEENPFQRQGVASVYAVYKDANGDVFLGIEVQ